MGTPQGQLLLFVLSLAGINAYLIKTWNQDP
jgi:hypothetical protein